MKIPKADKAVIATDKLCDYLLNPAHRRGDYNVSGVTP